MMTTEERVARLERLLIELCEAIYQHSDTEELRLPFGDRQPPLENTATRIMTELEKGK